MPLILRPRPTALFNPRHPDLAEIASSPSTAGATRLWSPDRLATMRGIIQAGGTGSRLWPVTQMVSTLDTGPVSVEAVRAAYSTGGVLHMSASSLETGQRLGMSRRATRGRRLEGLVLCTA